jgi:glycosyltransferase involved in cell wall biosynthesis
MRMPKGPSTSLVHDYLLVMRGAERVFEIIASCWPEARVHTLLYDPMGTEGRFAGREIRTSVLQRTGARQQGFRTLLPLFPKAAEHLAVQDSDVVISSSSAFAHGVRPNPAAVHLCYCHSPFRYAWHEYGRALEEVPKLVHPVARRVLRYVQRWDLKASRRVTHYVANSELTRRRIGDFYGRDASVLHPPVDLDRFHTSAPEDFLLVVTELVRHKQVQLALEAAKRACIPIKVVGTGPDLPRLRAVYADSAEFLGRVSDEQLADLYCRTRALVVPNIEEFGIAAVEAQASGRPVVAADAGGVQETVIDGTTGVLVPPGNLDALTEALAFTDFDRFFPEDMQRQAAQFSIDRFRERLLAEVETALGRRSSPVSV